MFRSRQWNSLIGVLNRISFHSYATSGTEGVAVALWALVTNWDNPEQAIIVAASFAGSAPVTSQMTGAFAGALHGDAWMPRRWMDELENGPGGRDEVMATARKLASLRCSTVGTAVQN
jgi:ADP-ribosylglycohydrolase